MKQALLREFKKVGLSITIEVGLRSTEFLDVILDVDSGKYRPYRKPESTLTYVNKGSNHPPNVLKNIPENIAKRVSGLCSDENTFNEVKYVYEEALNKEGYDVELKYLPKEDQNKVKKKRSRYKVVWYNPPYSSQVKTMVGHLFLALVEKHFKRGTKIGGRFNRNTLKLSYSCLPNMGAKLRHHNNKVLGTKQAWSEPESGVSCNCRDKTLCKVENKCKLPGALYSGLVVAEGKPDMLYYGVASNNFKERLKIHESDLRTGKVRTSITKYMADLDEKNIKYEVKWRLVKTGIPFFNRTNEDCQLCYWEKLYILLGPSNMLNSREELMNQCLHNIFQRLSHNSRNKVDGNNQQRGRPPDVELD